MDQQAALRQLEQEIVACLPHNPPVAAFHAMLRYPFGWVDDRLQPATAPTGKRIRPSLCLLCCEASGGDYHQALPAAAAVEMVHNFSLVHDDVQDRSRERRHRPSVWALWGEAQAINVGDALFTQARGALLRLRDRGVSDPVVLTAIEVLDAAGMALCEGQYLDMDFERREMVSEDEYYEMVRRKTGALLGCAAQLGALVGTGDRGVADGYRQLGEHLGVAFQVQDDILGIWGDPAVTGKPAADDIASRKKTLPVIYARRQAHGEAERLLTAYYLGREAPSASVEDAVAAITSLGARAYAEEAARHWYEQALVALDAVAPRHPAASDLRALAASLVGREA